MRKLGRMVRRVLTAVSLLLFVAVLAAWVRGYLGSDHLTIERDGWQPVGGDRACYYYARCEVEWAFGHVALYICRHNTGEIALELVKPGIRWERHFFRNITPNLVNGVGTPNSKASSLCGFKFLGEDDGRDSVYYVAFPCWMAAMVFGALPSWRGLVWWRGVRRRRLASREGRCGVCGYDLRASPQRCPECGTAVGGKGE